MTALFPPLSRNDVLAFQFSSWYARFKHASIKSTIIRPLDEDFRQYLLSDGVFIPEGSDILEEPDGGDDTDRPEKCFAFPEMDAEIRRALLEYDAVFPKLNFSSPKDSSWILPSSSPLKCTTPAEVYILLKSSDFVLHDVEAETVFDGCRPETSTEIKPYELELVLRKWYNIDPSREFRCFVHSKRLIAITQRDQNYYPYMNEQETRYKILGTITSLWKREIENSWPTDDYTFDLILTRNLESGRIVDFNPYAPRTDALLFTYEELHGLRDKELDRPLLRTIDSRSHEAGTWSSPANFHNMVPYEMLSMSAGKTIDDFARDWRSEVQRSMKDECI